MADGGLQRGGGGRQAGLRAALGQTPAAIDPQNLAQGGRSGVSDRLRWTVHNSVKTWLYPVSKRGEARGPARFFLLFSCSDSSGRYTAYYSVIPLHCPRGSHATTRLHLD